MIKKITLLLFPVIVCAEDKEDDNKFPILGLVLIISFIVISIILTLIYCRIRSLLLANRERSCENIFSFQKITNEYRRY